MLTIVLRGDQSWLLNPLGLMSAGCFAASYLFELVRQHYDDRDFEELENYAKGLRDRNPRQLSEPGLQALETGAGQISLPP